ncbi:acyl-CoA N-acyltransferase [Xylariaceae sp. FL0804]|nr:acyl-CoA N-acyltransferase [Xylariaceae sp. FL0804]
MPLELLPATAEDARRAVDIEADAFASNPFTPVLFPGPFPPDAKQRRAEELAAGLRADPTGCRWLKVVDTDLDDDGGGGGGGGQMIAFAKWHFYAAAAGDEEEDGPLNKKKTETSTVAAAATGNSNSSPPPPPPRAFGPGCNADACEALFGRIAASRRALVGGKPHAHLQTVHTDPAQQRRGAAGMLVRWGVAEARRLGLPAFLESSEAGHELYRRCGFRDAAHLALDLSPWAAAGGEGGGGGTAAAAAAAAGPHRTWSMICDP